MKGLFSITTIALTFLLLSASCSSDSVSGSSDNGEINVPDVDLSKSDVLVREYVADGKHRQCRPLAVANVDGDALQTYAAATMNMLKAGVKYNSQQSSGKSNVAFSPLSATLTLAMVSNAVKDGEDNFFKEFLGDLDIQTVNSLVSQIIPQLQQGDGLTQLSFNNSIWVNQPVTGFMPPDALDTYTKTFLTSVFYRDYVRNAETVTTEINNWCSEKTGGDINDYYRDLDGSTYCNILNALTFKAPWQSEFFNEEWTENVLFEGTVSASDVRMMVGSDMGFINHYTSADYEMVEIPFGNGTYAMYMIKQTGSVDVESLTDALDLEVFNALKSNSKPYSVEVTMPPFKVSTDFEMDEFLTSNTERFGELTFHDLTIFDTDIDFSVRVRQSNTVSVDFEGASGAVITSADFVETGTLDPLEPRVVKVVFDRPFVFAISEYSTGLPVFGGLVTNL